MTTPQNDVWTNGLVATDHIVKPKGLGRVFHPSSFKGDEIGFLRLRRSGIDGPLNPIGNGGGR